jgi:heptose I phosphotransferase
VTSSTLLPTPTADPRDAAIPAEDSHSGVQRRGTFHGLCWTYQSGVEALLQSLASGAWERPEQQGWNRVKHNARREVWRGTIAGTPCFLKYYFSEGWRTRVKRLFRPAACVAEWTSGVFAQEAGIPAVRPLAYAQDLRRAGRHCDVLVTEAVEPTQPLSEFWQHMASDDDAHRRRTDIAALTDLLAQMIARSHQAGFEHLDMHAANILVESRGRRRYRTLFVDLQCARQAVPIRDGAVVRNLAQLNQWFRRHSTIGERLRFLRAYLRWRNEYEHAFAHGRALGLDFAQLVRALAQAARRHAQRLGTRRDHRAQRNGRYFTRLRLPGGWRAQVVTRCKHAAAESPVSRLVLERSWWQKQLGAPLGWFAAPAADAADAICKESHSAQVRRAKLVLAAREIPVIVKRPRARNWRRALAQCLPPSRSARGWRIGHALLHRDIPAARPLAVLERRVGPLVFDSMLITEAIPEAVDLETYLRQEYARRGRRAWKRLKRTLIPRVAMLIRRTQERGFHHRDCKASNILVVPHLDHKLLWIDMDGLRQVRRLSAEDRLRPLVRLDASLRDVPGITLTDRVRLLRSYVTRFGTAPDGWRTLWSEVAPASERKVRALAARRAWKRRAYGRE